MPLIQELLEEAPGKQQLKKKKIYAGYIQIPYSRRQRNGKVFKSDTLGLNSKTVFGWLSTLSSILYIHVNS